MEQTKAEWSLIICFQVLLPPYDDSVSVPLKQAPPPFATATAWTQCWSPAGWTLLLMKPRVESYAPHCLSSLQYICGYTVLLLQTHTHTQTRMCITIQPCMHGHVQNHPTHVHTQTSTTTVTSHPALVFIANLLILSLCAIPEMICIWCIWTWMKQGTGKLDRWFSIFLLILLNVYCVCICNSIVCVLDIFHKCENEGLAAHSGERAAITCFLFILSLLTIRVGLPSFWTFSLTGAVYPMREGSPRLEVLPKKLALPALRQDHRAT